MKPLSPVIRNDEEEASHGGPGSKLPIFTKMVSPRNNGETSALGADPQRVSMFVK